MLEKVGDQGLTQAHTHTYVCLLCGGGDQICLLPQVTVPFWRGHAWRCPHFEPGVGYIYVCATTKNTVFIPTPLLIFLADFYAWRLTAESNVRLRWQYGQLYKVLMWIVCVCVCVCNGQSFFFFFKGDLQNPTVTKKTPTSYSVRPVTCASHAIWLKLEQFWTVLKGTGLYTVTDSISMKL